MQASVHTVNPYWLAMLALLGHCSCLPCIHQVKQHHTSFITNFQGFTVLILCNIGQYQDLTKALISVTISYNLCTLASTISASLTTSGSSSKPINCDPYRIFLWAVNWFNDSSILHHLDYAEGSVKCSAEFVRLSLFAPGIKTDSITGFEFGWFSTTIVLFLLSVLGFLHTASGQLPCFRHVKGHPTYTTATKMWLHIMIFR